MEKYSLSNRYSVLKRIKKIVSRLSDYLTGSVDNPKEITILLSEFEFLLKVIKTLEHRYKVPENVLDRLVIFLRTFKQYYSLRKNITAPEGLNIENIEDFLLRELGAKEKQFIHKTAQLPKYLLI